MTTAVEVKRLVRPLLERHPDLAFAQRCVVVKPLHHVMSAVLLDRQLDPDGIRLRWYVDNFFGLGHRLHISWGEDIVRPETILWKRTQPDMQHILVQEIERKGLPLVRAVNDLEISLRVCVRQLFSPSLV